jgi:hypothetical protein
MIDIADIKLAVLECAFGIKSLEDKELYEHLERFWADAYKRGSLDTGEAIIAHCREKNLRLAQTVESR